MAAVGAFGDSSGERRQQQQQQAGADSQAADLRRLVDGLRATRDPATHLAGEGG